MSLVVLLKAFSKVFRAQRATSVYSLQADDYFLLAALSAAIGQSVTVSQQVPAGLGQHMVVLTASQIRTYQK
ncbi:hypothetical protein MMC25_007075, partial [Agyrium rufum]|nr:hypothetical protein [Agyrium rufum]